MALMALSRMAVAAEVCGGDVVEGQVQALGDHAGRGGDQFLGGVEVVRGDRRPRPVDFDDVEHALVLIVGVDAFEYTGLSDGPKDAGEFVLVVGHSRAS
jgi:hypothetical protein